MIQIFASSVGRVLAIVKNTWF